MKKLFFILLVFAIAIPAFADNFDFKITGSAPTVSGTGADTVNPQIATAFNSFITELNHQFGSVFQIGAPTKFLGAMANSSVYSSHGATTRAYGGYKILSATIGPMFGFQLPGSFSSIMNDLGNITRSLEETGDINLGINPNMININFGLNMGIIKLDKLYLGVRLGYFKLPSLMENFKYDYFTFGATVNYQILPSLSLAKLITWRGLSLGSGLIYNGSNIKVSVPLGNPINQPIGSTSANIYMDPIASLNLNTKTVTIPIEAITAIKLLIFNIPFGLGADLAFGKTSLAFGVDSDIELRGLSSGLTQNKKGDISVKASKSIAPSFFNLKIMTGLGFIMGPVVIDIPLTFYPTSHGYAFGFTMGAVL